MLLEKSDEEKELRAQNGPAAVEGGHPRDAQRGNPLALMRPTNQSRLAIAQQGHHEDVWPSPWHSGRFGERMKPWQKSQSLNRSEHSEKTELDGERVYFKWERRWTIF